MAQVTQEVRASKHIWPFVYTALLFGMLGWLNFITADNRQYSRLAEAFLEGKLFLLSTPKAGADTAAFGGHYYSALGPFPALLIMPLVWTGYYQQGQLSFIASLAVFYLCLRLARRLDYSGDEPCWFALAFCFGTSFIGVSALAGSNFFAHVLSVMVSFWRSMNMKGKPGHG